VLEEAGFRVVAARTLMKVIDACDSRHIDMAMIGYSLPPAEKRRVWTEIHQRCKVPILELYRGDKAELMEESVHTHQSSTPEDFLHTIQRLLRDAD
jgi:DNA-binding response OmpR family regulator